MSPFVVVSQPGNALRACLDYRCFGKDLSGMYNFTVLVSSFYSFSGSNKVVRAKQRMTNWNVESEHGQTDEGGVILEFQDRRDRSIPQKLKSVLFDSVYYAVLDTSPPGNENQGLLIGVNILSGARKAFKQLVKPYANISPLRSLAALPRISNINDARMDCNTTVGGRKSD